MLVDVVSKESGELGRLDVGVRRVALTGLFLILSVAGANPLEAQVPGFRIQVAATGDEAGAAALRDAASMRLDEELPVYVVSEKGLFKVRIGDFPKRSDAIASLSLVKAAGYSDAWIAADPGTLDAGSAVGGGGSPRQIATPQAGHITAPVRTERESVGSEVAPNPNRGDVGNATGMSRGREAVVADSDVLDAPAKSEDTKSEPENSGQPRYMPTAPVPYSEDQPLMVDGVISEPVWELALPGAVKRPRSQSGAAPETSVLFVHDEEAFYIAAQVRHADPTRQRALRRRDLSPGDEERVVVSLSRDGELAVSFGVTFTGVRIEYVKAESDNERVWGAGTTIHDGGWNAEFRVPFELLGIEDGQARPWDVSVRWEDPRGAPTARDMPLPVDQFARAFRPGGRSTYAIRPWVQTSATRTVGAEFESALTRVGGELSVRTESGVEAQVAIQPDDVFDPHDRARVNLTPYDGFFPETRSQYRNLTPMAPSWGPRLFYSRRIGSAAQGTPSTGAIENLQPTNVLGVGHIVGARGRTEYTFLSALVGRGEVLRGDGEGALAPVELSPRSWFGVGRVERALGGRGRLGLTVTSVVRTFGSDSGVGGSGTLGSEGVNLESALAGNAFVGGVDVTWPLGSRGSFRAFAGGSRIGGSQAALIGIQQGTGHYFQRPDADHVSVDESATSMAGVGGGAQFVGNVDGIRWIMSGSAYSPGYNIRDAGFLRRADWIDLELGLGFGTRRFAPNDLVRDPWRFPEIGRLGFDMDVRSAWNFGGVKRGTFSSMTGWYRTGSVVVDGRLGYRTEGLSDDLTRGGPLMAQPSGWIGSLALVKEVAAGNRGAGSGGERVVKEMARVRIGLGVDGAGDALEGEFLRIRGLAEWAPSRNVGVSVEPEFLTQTDPRQYVMSVDRAGPETYGSRYVFSRLAREEFSARVGLSLRPFKSLRIGAYVEPFLSTGDYDQFGELAEAGTNELRRYGDDGTSLALDEDGNASVQDGTESFVIPAPGFAVRSLRSQVMVDWDWAGDGTVSVTWRQSRTGFENRYESLSLRSFQESLEDLGRGLLAIRFAYKLGWD